MQLRNSADRYGAITKTLHWSVFAIVVVQFAAGLGGSVDDDTHGSLGLVLLALVIVRLLWRWVGRLPDWAPGLSAGERRLAHWTERMLYLFLIIKPVTGLLYIGADGDEVEFPGYGELPTLIGKSNDLEDTFASAHAWAGYALLLAIAVHLALVFKHQFIDRDRYANRMLPFTRQ